MTENLELFLARMPNQKVEPHGPTRFPIFLSAVVREYTVSAATGRRSLKTFLANSP